MGILKRIRPRAFYKSALSEAEQELLPAARKVEGLGEEIAILRVRLYAAVKEHPSDFPLMLAGIGMLVRAVATHYPLSPNAQKDLAARVTAALNSLGDQLLPADR